MGQQQQTYDHSRRSASSAAQLTFVKKADMHKADIMNEKGHGKCDQQITPY